MQHSIYALNPQCHPAAHGKYQFHPTKVTFTHPFGLSQHLPVSKTRKETSQEILVAIFPPSREDSSCWLTVLHAVGRYLAPPHSVPPPSPSPGFPLQVDISLRAPPVAKLENESYTWTHTPFPIATPHGRKKKKVPTISVYRLLLLSWTAHLTCFEEKAC